MTGKYILDGQTQVPADFMTWAKWFAAAGEKRVVAKTEVGSMCVSTVFLGLDHRLGEGPPLLFETMIFGLPGPASSPLEGGRVALYTGTEEYQERCSTWEQAEAMHARAVAHARSHDNE